MTGASLGGGIIQLSLGSGAVRVSGTIRVQLSGTVAQSRVQRSGAAQQKALRT